ncbi:MAG: hypothetical protein P4L27_05330 [Ignavibacteriaceae bacterium]|nr:hypothetical protein [Ignavibacteriaceae bacterium]
MKKFIFLIFLLLSFATFAQIRGGWNYEAGLESTVGIGEFSHYIPFALGPVGTIEYRFPYAYFSIGGTLGVLFASDGITENSYESFYYSNYIEDRRKLTSLKIGIQSEVQLGNSNYAISFAPVLIIPLKESVETYSWREYYNDRNIYQSYEKKLNAGPYFSIETSCHAKINLTDRINTIAKLGIGLIDADDQLGYYIKLGFMIQGSIGY